MVVEIKGNIINPLNNYFPKIDVINSVNDVTDNGIYLLLEESSSSSIESTPASEMVLYYDETAEYPSLYGIYQLIERTTEGDIDWSNYPVVYDDGTITSINETVPFQTSGNHIVTIDWTNLPTTINDHEYVSDLFVDEAGLYKIVLPYGLTTIYGSLFNYTPEPDEIEIPKTVIDLDPSLAWDSTNYILHWDNANNIVAYSTWISSSNTNVTFSIPYGTTALYTDAGYPSAKLTERQQEASSNTTTVSEIYIKKDDNEIHLSNNNETENDDNLDLLLLNLTEEISKL